MPTITLADLRTLVYARVEDNTLLYTTAEVDAVINEAMRLTNLFTAFNQTSIQLPNFTVADQLLYDVPFPIIFPTRIAYEGKDLDKTGLIRIAQDYRYWATDTTNTYGPVGRWVPIGIKRFALHPIDSIGGASITITGVAEPTLLVAPGDVMQLDDDFVTLIVDYCGHRLVLKEGGKVFSDASLLIQSYWRNTKQLKRWQTFKAPRYFVQVQQPL